MAGKDWKKNRKPQGTATVQVPKLSLTEGPPAGKIPNGRRPIPIKQAAFCNIKGALGLVIGVSSETIPVGKVVTAVDAKSGLVTCGKESFLLDTKNLKSLEDFQAKFKYIQGLEQLVKTQEQSLSQANTELRATQKELLQLRASVKKVPNSQGNIF